jgi:hypothetical protein
MFSALLHRVEDRCAVLENFLRLCDAVDEVGSDPSSALFRELQVLGIREPNITEDRVFRHCAVMTQLYGLYESFSESMLSAWLFRLPRYYALPDLPEGFKNAYRHGIARIIQNVDHRRYRHISLPGVVEKYLAALQGASPWEFVNEALTLHDANLRQSEFVTMFNSVDLTGVWQSLEKNAHILNFKAETDSDESLENLVLDLVTFRNEASHGTPDEILGSDTLREWVAFVRAFCSALADVITHRIVAAEVANQPESVIGIVTETFKNNTVVAICDRGSLSVGETIYFLRQSDCTSAAIESLQLNDVPQLEIHIDGPGVEVGVRTSTRVHKNARLVRLKEATLDKPIEVTSSVKERAGGFIGTVSSVLSKLKNWFTR